MRQRTHWLVLILIFLSVFIAHLSSTNITSMDSIWSIPTAMSIIKEGNTDLDEYPELLEEKRFLCTEYINGHYYNYFPIGVSIIAVPFVFILDKLLDPILAMAPGLEEYMRTRMVRPGPINVITAFGGAELFVACIVISITSIFIYLIAGLYLNRRYSLLVTFIFAFCTSAWSTGSRALWEHGPSILMLTLALYLILLARNKPWLVQFASIPLAFSFMIRPTNSIPIILLTVFVFIQYRKYFLHYLLWAIPIAVTFIAFNFSIYNFPISPYYMPQRLGTNPAFFEALLANFFSPTRGLFIFCPVFLFTIYGIVLKIRNANFEKLDYFLLGIIFAHLIAISSFHNWWAGFAFGPRFFSDMTPYFIYFLIPVIGAIPKFSATRKLVLVSLLSFFILISFFIHFRGATSWDTVRWNWEPDIMRAERVWDWTDLQFLRGIN